MTTLTIRKIGNSEGAIFPKEILAKLNVRDGDMLYVTETPNGIALSPYDPMFEKQMDIAERIMREDRDVLRRLAE